MLTKSLGVSPCAVLRQAIIDTDPWRFVVNENMGIRDQVGRAVIQTVVIKCGRGELIFYRAHCSVSASRLPERIVLYRYGDTHGIAGGRNRCRRKQRLLTWPTRRST